MWPETTRKGRGPRDTRNGVGWRDEADFIKADLPGVSLEKTTIDDAIAVSEQVTQQGTPEPRDVARTGLPILGEIQIELRFLG